MNKDFSTSFKDVSVLFELLKKINNKETKYLKQMYSQSAKQYDECINFLFSMELINITAGYIKPTPTLSKFLLESQGENQTKEFLINTLFRKRDVYIEEYFSKFSISNDKYIFEPMTSENLRFSNLRNLLIELEFISYNQDQKYYEITEKYLPLFFEIIKEHTISPDQLKKIIEEQDEIGKNAELEIVNYERLRLSFRQDLVFAIEHKSIKDTSLGYDIKSFTVNDGSEVMDRYIEVKAISNFREKFYITINEVETSKKFGSQYFLYLLPAIGKNRFDLNNLIIIQNPFCNIFNNNEWEVSCDKFLIKKKTFC